MSFRDLFRKRVQDEVVGTKILVASLDPKFVELVKADSHCYSQFYPTPTEAVFETIQELLQTVGGGYDIVHLFCDVSPSGKILDGCGNEITGTALIQNCSNSEVKLLWLASGNGPEGYIKNFKPAAGKPLNLVMTIDRRGPRFPDFLQRLLAKMSAGDTMPVAWVSLCPQNSSDPRNQDAPVCIFAAGRGAVRLR